jgi:hypothetical protein
MHLNMFLVPLIGISTDNGLSVISGFFSWKQVRSDFVYGTSGTCDSRSGLLRDADDAAALAGVRVRAHADH